MSKPSALLLTDIVDSTALSSQLGDAEASVLWQAHERVARDLLLEWHGREIDKSDGFLMLFSEAEDALGFALAYHRALRSLPVPLRARVGIHVGPVTLRHTHDADVARGAKPLEVDGLAKALAARVMALAQGGQTLLTGHARAALTMSTLRFECHGHWRLKGIDAPVELHEAGDSDSPFLPPPDSDKAFRVVHQDELWLPVREVRHSLPSERDAFIGRRDELSDLARRFNTGARLVSILGIGGAGKTRLAQRYGWTWLGEFPGGVWFCDLSQARSIDGVGHAVAQGLDVPLGSADPITQLGNALAGRGACLVILDNFEQVVGFAEQTVGRWIDRAPEARFIVTSREVLGIRGEEAFALAPLDSADAAVLFIRRAEAAVGEFQPSAADQAAITPLVELLDGLPLAIELAAARVRVMSPHALLRRMNERFTLLTSRGNRPDRQATLRATFDWSWDLLSALERAMFAQLSVFEGSFTLSAAEAIVVLHERGCTDRVVDLLQSLIEKSLVRRLSDHRFGLFVSVKEYAAEHMPIVNGNGDSGLDAHAAVRQRHCTFFSTLSEAVAVADSCADLDNLVTACRRAVVMRDARSAVGALEGAWAALRLRGPYKVGVDLAALVRGMPDLSRGESARVDRLRGWTLRQCGRVAEAGSCFKAALAAAREIGDTLTERRVLSHLGTWYVEAGYIDEARANLNAALALARAASDRGLECEVLCELGNLSEHLGNFGEARVYYEAALALARASKERSWEGGSLGNLGLLCANQGNLAEARSYYEAGLAVAHELGDRRWEGNTLCNLGLLHQVQGRLQDARATLDKALTVAKELGYVRLGAIVMCNLGIVCEALGASDEARKQFEDALVVVRELNDRRSQGQFLNYLGLLHAREDRFTEAMTCLDAGEALLIEVADKLSLGVLLCSRAEAQLRVGNVPLALAALEQAAALQAEIGAKSDSELGQSLHRVRQAMSAHSVRSHDATVSVNP